MTTGTIGSKMMVTVKESSMVKPSKTTPDQRIWNSNLDLIVGRIHILTLYFYRPNGSDNFFDSRVLKKSLADVLVWFFPMAGRLGVDGDGRVEINCNGEGVLFVEAEADCKIDDFGEITPSPELRRLVPTVDYSGDISSYPLVVTQRNVVCATLATLLPATTTSRTWSAPLLPATTTSRSWSTPLVLATTTGDHHEQVTRFKCGGISLGCGLHHTLSDGLSSLHFINEWSNVTRGLSVTVPPFVDRTILRARDPPNVMFDHVEYQTLPSTNANSDSEKARSSPVHVSTSILRLTSDQLNAIKTKGKGDGSVYHSTYEILAAHLWRCACKSRGLLNDQPTKLYVATDGRSRLIPPLPPGYLGNVVFTATPVAKSGELDCEPLAKTARRIHTELAKMNNEYLRSALDYLESQPDLLALIRGPTYFASPNLNINSWTRLPIYDSDFGWGRPIFMGPANILYEGTIYVIPNPSNDRSVSLAVCLDSSHMSLFQKYLYEF